MTRRNKKDTCRCEQNWFLNSIFSCNDRVRNPRHVSTQTHQQSDDAGIFNRDTQMNRSQLKTTDAATMQEIQANATRLLPQLRSDDVVEFRFTEWHSELDEVRDLVLRDISMPRGAKMLKTGSMIANSEPQWQRTPTIFGVHSDSCLDVSK
eukprot:2693174-Rhodomonas_salina.1